MVFRHTRIPVLTMLLWLCIGVSSTGAQSLEALREQLHTRYDNMVALKATFAQVTSSSYLDESEQFSGTILLSGARYRIEMEQQIIVSDAIVTWVFNRPQNQVLLTDYEEDETTFSLSSFLAEFDTAYTMSDYRQIESMDVVNLTPSDPLSPFQLITIWVTDGTVNRLDIVDVNDVKMQFELRDIRFNPDIPDGSFLFSIPEGAEIVDLREN